MSGGGSPLSSGLFEVEIKSLLKLSLSQKESSARMGQILNIHAENPQMRLVAQVSEALAAGGVVVYPTDACYGVGCSLDNKRGMDRIRRIRQLREDHEFTLLCRDLDTAG